MSQKKIFTYREARELIPQIRELTRKAYSHVEEVSEELRSPNLTEERRAELESEFTSAVSDWADQLSSFGVEIKGLWLVDFDNGKGYYCWKYPEKSLDHFHTYEDGFSGRMRIN